MDVFEHKIPEVQEFLYRHRVTSHGRRQTVHVTDRGKTAIGLHRNPGTPLRTTFLLRRTSVTPTPVTKAFSALESPRHPSIFLNRRSSHDVKSPRFPASKIKKAASAPLYDKRGLLNLHQTLTLPPHYRKGVHSYPLSPKQGVFTYSRRKSRLHSGPDSDEFLRKKRLLAKFRIAVKIAIFCSRKFKEHCLSLKAKRLNENRDELAPYIKRLHFHEEDNNDLLIDLSKFKANRQMRIPEETKRILSKEVTERTEREVYTVTLALRNIKSFSEYPRRMQQKIAEVGLYEKYESKRMIVRQGHPASAFYFILSGAVVVMVMDEESKYARPVAHLYKGQTFGELAIINGTKRISSVIAKETCEFMSISARDYHKIFMAGGVKNINDPDQEIFLKSLSCLADWPIHKLQETPNKCQFLFFKNGEVIVRDSHYSDWIIVVKSGSIEVLKKLRRVEAFEWKRKKPPEVLNGTKRREIILKRVEWRRILPEIRVALNPDEDSANVEFLGNGRPAPFVHPDPQTGKVEEEDEEEVRVKHVKKSTQIPNLWPFRVDISEIESGRYLDDYRGYELPHRMPTVFETEGENSTRPGRQLNRLSKNSLGIKSRDRSNSMIQEEEKELLGYQPHIRTIIDDIDAGIKRKDDEGHVDPRDINPEFVHVQTLTKGQVFGLTDLLIGDQPSLSVVSRGADCLLINKNFYMEHASEKLLREMRQELCPYPTEEEMQDRLQVSVDWQAYKKNMLSESVSSVCSRKMMRVTLNGTKTQEAFVY